MIEGDDEQGAMNKIDCSLPCRRSFAGARVAPQQLPYPPANTLILPESLLGWEAGLPLSRTIDRAKRQDKRWLFSY